MLTLREEEVLQKLWEHGPMSVRQLVELYPEPQPHVNTVSTVVRTLEAKDFVGHESNGQGFVYFAKIAKDSIRDRSLGQVIKNYFSGSYIGAVSTLVEEEKISLDELKELIDMIEKK